MYLGIDLGTSNSVIVGNRAGRLELFKTITGEDVLPSVVMRDRSGNLSVGRRAYEQMRMAPDGIAARFKRLLGTSTVLPFGPEGGTITPVEASAAVIGELLRQAVARIGDEPVQGAIVTVPAAFNQMQNEATIAAARAAGLEQVGLLQEPVAAAMACMEDPSSRDGLFLVYDLGGGTFDAALVRALGGNVTVEAHEGINMLGGTDFDRMILETIVEPWLRANFTLPTNIAASPQAQRLLALVKAHIERAKVELSSVSETMIAISEQETGARDLDGKPIWCEVTLRREDVERIVAERIDRSIALCRKILADHGYQPSDVDKVVLIGGPSRMPVVRERVPGELGIAFDHDVDPMTAVARGAAIYAEGREWAPVAAKPGAVAASGSKQARRREASAEVTYDYEARTTSDRARIRVVAAGEAEGWQVRANGPGGEDYGTRAVAEKPVFAIALAPGETVVRMSVTDAAGDPVEGASRDLMLTRITAIASGAPCTATIAVKVEEADGERAINVLEPLIDKGEVLPKSGQRTFRAARKVIPGSDDCIDVELYEAAEGVPEPEANLLIGAFRLTGRDLPMHARPLMPGDEVVLHWSVDDNQLIRASVELPGCGLHLSDHSFYADDLAHINFGADGRQFATEALLAVQLDLHALRSTAMAVLAREIGLLQSRIDEQETRIEQAWEADTFRSITEELRLLRQEISRLRHKPKARGFELQSQIDELEQRARRNLANLSEAGLAEVGGHLATARNALAQQQFGVCERALEAGERVIARAVVETPGFVTMAFMHARTQRHAAVDKAKFDQLVAVGDTAAAAGDEGRLRQVLSQIHAILIDAGGQTANATAQAGLRR